MELSDNENSSEFKDMVKTLEKLDAETKESKKRLASNRKENKAFLDKALSEIKKFRNEINDHLDKVEKEIVSEANKMYTKIEAVMSGLEKITSVAEKDIADLRKNLDSTASADLRKNLDSTAIQGEKLSIRMKLNSVDGNISYVRNNNVLESFTFEQEKQLAGMIRSGLKLGRLRMDNAPEEALAEEQFLRPDPRADDFKVDSRVESTYRGIAGHMQRGTVKQVDPTGNVTVLWDWGSEDTYNKQELTRHLTWISDK